MDIITTFFNKISKEDIPEQGKSLNTSFGRVKVIKNEANIQIQTNEITISFSENNDQVSYNIFYNNFDDEKEYSVMNLTDTMTIANVAYMQDKKFYQVFLNRIIVKHLPLINKIKDEYFIDGNIIYKRVNRIEDNEYFQGYDLRLNNNCRYFKIRYIKNNQEQIFKVPLGYSINSVIAKYNELIEKVRTFELTDLGFEFLYSLGLNNISLGWFDNIPSFITEDDEARNLAELFTMKFEYLGNVEKLNQSINLSLLNEILRKMGLVYSGIIQERKLTMNSEN